MKLKKNNPGEGHQPHGVPGITDVFFFLLPLPPPPAEADIAVRRIVRRPRLNLVKVRPQVEPPAAVLLMAENVLCRCCPVTPPPRGTSPCTILLLLFSHPHRQTRGRDPGVHVLGIKVADPMNVPTGPDWVDVKGCVSPVKKK